MSPRFCRVILEMKAVSAQSNYDEQSLVPALSMSAQRQGPSHVLGCCSDWSLLHSPGLLTNDTPGTRLP